MDEVTSSTNIAARMFEFSTLSVASKCCERKHEERVTVTEIRQIILNDKFFFIRSIQRQLSTNDAEKFYAEHKEFPDTIRGRFGASDTRNATHGSDSMQSAENEILFFFPDFSISQWLNDDEPLLRRFAISNGANRELHLHFDKDKWLHRIEQT
ncbi:hypothetical protein RDWZM_009378 [Blomia tropicalis]|uniref:Nucleoside diphosphate kinase n=1 Tax=Blomia tropicalis TaxID=40697 RepID=A0A9Q0M2V2_BLOTA|nr:hypothetical protein RDWZM_009378 [Blomia tropicalis]